MPTMNVGGAEHHAVKLCHSVSRDEVELSVSVLFREGAHELLSMLPSDVRVSMSPFPRRDPRVVRWLMSDIRALCAYCIHSFVWAVDLVASLASLGLRGVPLIASERGDRTDLPLFRHFLDRLLTFRIADRFCANSEFGARLLVASGCVPDKITFIRNGIDLKRIDSCPAEPLRQRFSMQEGDIVVGTVSRLVWYKGVDDLLRAAAVVASPRVRYVIVGDGPERQALEALARSLGVNERVFFVGQQVPAYGFTKGFDVGVTMTVTNTGALFQQHCRDMAQANL